MANCSESFSQQATELNVLAGKSQQDAAAGIQNQTMTFSQNANNQALVDNQANSRAWDEVNLAAARDAQLIKHLAQINILTASQTGQTENQQAVSPIRTGVGDNLGAGSIPANRAIDANTALGQGAITANVANVLAAWLAAQVATAPVLVTASGGASTPSQTTPKVG